MKIEASMLIALVVSTLVGAEESVPMRTLYDFDGRAESKNWRSVNDTVMGGRSHGGSRVFPEEGWLQFSGTLSLKNRGGFASIRSVAKSHDLTGFVGIALRVRGDGRRYLFNVHTDQIPYGGSYRAEFATKKDEWLTIHMPFVALRPTFHGRYLPKAPAINLRQVTSVGLTLADKREGRFKVEVDWLKAYRGFNRQK